MADNEAPQQEQSTEEEQAEESDAVKKKSAKGGGGGPSQKLVFIVLVMNTVVVIALAAVVWMGYKKSSSQVTLGDIAAEKDGKKEEAKEGKGEGEKGKKEGEKDAPPDNFIKESFTVNLADSQGSHFAQVEVNIEVDDAFAKEEIQKIRPKIRDFIVVVLSSKTFEQVESNDGKDFLREEIRNKINGYLTRGQIKNVYFTQFIVQ